MSRSSHRKSRIPQFQGLEARQLMAADLSFGVAEAGMAGRDANAEAGSAHVATAAHNEAPVAAVEVAQEVDLAKSMKYSPLDSPEIVHRVYNDLGHGEPMPDHGLGDLGGEKITYDQVEELEGTDNGPVAGEVPEISIGYQASLDGANSQVPGAHPNQTPGKGSESQKVLNEYAKGGIDTTGKSASAMQHLCMSPDQDAYKRTDESGSKVDYNSGSLLNTSGAPKKEEKKDDTTGSPATNVGGGGDAEDDSAGEDSSGDGDGTPPADPPAASQPDYGEGYMDPNNPLLNRWSDFTDAYWQHNFDADQGSEINPNPMSDLGVVSGTPTNDHRDWVDGGHTVIDVTVPDWAVSQLQNHDDGRTDPPRY